MKELVASCRTSLRLLRNIRALCLAAMFMALSVVLGYFSIEAGPYLRIGFGSLVNAFVCMLFGPVFGMAYQAVLDILKYIAKPTGPFFFGFTFNAVLAGLIYGLMLYRKPVSFRRILIAEGLVAVIVNIFFNTLWLSVLYGKGFLALLPARLLKNLIKFPVDAAIFYFIAKRMEALGFRDRIREITEQQD